MAKTIVTSDLHIGHRAICMYRTQFATVEEHDECIIDAVSTSLSKRDTLMIIGDASFTLEGLEKIKAIKCKSKVLMLGNHDIERSVKMVHLIDTYDKIYSLHARRNVWFSHVAIHPSQMRDKLGCIHGHDHESLIMRDKYEYIMGVDEHVGIEPNPKYFNACLEHNDYKPVLFATIMEQFQDASS